MVVLTSQTVRCEPGPVGTVAPVAVVEATVEPPAEAMNLVRGDPGPGAALAAGVEAPAVMEAVAMAMEVPPRPVRHRPLAVAAVGAVNESAIRLPMR